MKISIRLLLFFLLAVSVLLAVSPADAGTGKRRGTASGVELLIPVGSRGTGLGGNVSSTISGIEAIYWNPAGLAVSSTSAEVMFSHLRYIADINVNYAAASFRFGIGSIGLSVKSLDFGEILETTELQTEGTGATLNPSFVTLGLTYSRQMTDRIAFGVTGKVLSEKVLSTSASTFAFDFGLQYATSVKGLKLGVTLKNLGPNLQFSGSDAETRVTPGGSEPSTRNRNFRVPLGSFELPTTLELGVSYDVAFGEKSLLTFSGNFLNHNFGLDQYGLAAEYNLNKTIFLRGGYTISYDPDTDKFKSQDDEYLFGPSFGGGVNFKVSEKMHLNLDYAYRMTELFDDNQWFTFTLTF
ncbi:PorV/PorQ family protein [candidate division KSB1 bacterium]|nr:PorV/PorQ family protein [candidate division KSB1 bacterium]